MPDIHVPNAELKVGVLMITYNHEKFIAQALESVLMQKADFPFELVIGDDCSTDGTREIVREYSQKYPEIIRAHLRERNIGAKENFRQVFLASRGRYLALLEGDDYWTDSRKLQLLADVLDAHPETTLRGHRTIRHDEDGARPDEVAARVLRSGSLAARVLPAHHVGDVSPRDRGTSGMVQSPVHGRCAVVCGSRGVGTFSFLTSAWRFTASMGAASGVGLTRSSDPATAWRCTRRITITWIRNTVPPSEKGCVLVFSRKGVCSSMPAGRTRPGNPCGNTAAFAAPSSFFPRSPCSP